MRRPPPSLFLTAAAAVTAMALLGCSSDDGDDDEGATEYAVAVEAITDEIGSSVSDAQVALNEVGDQGSGADDVAATLDAVAETVADAADRLSALETPEGAETVADDLAFTIGDLARHLTEVATDLRGASVGQADLHDVTIAGGRLLLASESGVSALSRALRTLAVELAD